MVIAAAKGNVHVIQVHWPNSDVESVNRDGFYGPHGADQAEFVAEQFRNYLRKVAKPGDEDLLSCPDWAMDIINEALWRGVSPDSLVVAVARDNENSRALQ